MHVSKNRGAIKFILEKKAAERPFSVVLGKCVTNLPLERLSYNEHAIASILLRGDDKHSGSIEVEWVGEIGHQRTIVFHYGRSSENVGLLKGIHTELYSHLRNTSMRERTR